MPIDREKIKSAIDSFEDDDFVGSKETLASEIKKKVAEFVADKTEVSLDVEKKDKKTDDDDKENKDTGEEE